MVEKDGASVYGEADWDAVGDALLQANATARRILALMEEEATIRQGMLRELRETRELLERSNRSAENRAQRRVSGPPEGRP